MLVIGVVVIVAVAAFALGRATAGSHAVSPATTAVPTAEQTPPSAMVGYWIATESNAVFRCLEIRNTVLEWSVGTEGSSPWVVPANGSRLVLQAGKPKPANVTTMEPRIELGYALGRVEVMVTDDPPDGPASTYTFTRASPDAYRASAQAAQDSQMRQAIEQLGNAIVAWTAQSFAGFPKPAQIVPDSTWGKWFAHSRFGGWVYNPYSTGPYGPTSSGPPLIKQGSRPGEFTYRNSGSGFVLVGHLAEGKNYTIRSSDLP